MTRSKMIRSTRSRRLNSALVLGAASILALSGCVSSGSDSSSGASKQFSIGSDLTYPPYAFMEAGKPVGFDVEIGNALAAQMNRKPRFVDTRFEQLIAGVQAGRFDAIISSLYITKERASAIDYIPYFSTGTSIVALSKEAAPPTTIQELCGKKVASIKGSAILPSLRGEASDACKKAGKKAIAVAEFPTDPEASQSLISGQADVQLTEAAVAKVAVDKSSGTLKITSTELLYPIAVGIAVKKGSEALKNDIQRALDALKSNGEYDKILAKYNVKPADEALVEKALGN